MTTSSPSPVLLSVGLALLIFPSGRAADKDEEPLKLEDILAVYQNEAKGDLTYLDKVITIRFVVGSVRKESGGKRYFVRGGPQQVGDAATCYFEHAEDVASLQFGDEVVISGKCAGIQYAGSFPLPDARALLLTDCKLVKVKAAK